MVNKLKHIAILGGEANIHNRVGSNVYAFEIIKNLELVSRKEPNWYFTVLLNQPPVSDLPKPRKNWRYQVFGPNKLWTQWALPIYLFFNKNRFHGLLSPGHYTPKISPIPMIATIMDIAFLEFPKQFKFLDYWQLKIWTRQTIDQSSGIIAISNFTKNKIIEHYSISAKKITTIYPALPSKLGKISVKLTPNQPIIINQHYINKPYILYLGTIQPRKNIIALVKALEIFTDRTKIDFDLIIAGKLGWLAEPIIKVIDQSSIKEKIKILGFVTSEEKAILLKNAKLLSVLGQHEGFGFPILEAFSYSTPVLTFNNGSLPETGGKGCFYINNLEPLTISKEIEKIFNLNPKERAAIAKKGREQLNKFNWQKSSLEVLELMEKIF